MKRKIVLKDIEIEYSIIFKNKKNISIKIDNKMNILVYSPKGIAYEYLDKLIIEKSKWIIKSMENIEKGNLVEEDRVILLGKYYETIIKKSNINRVFIEKDKVIINTVSLEKTYTRKLIVDWYKKIATDIIGARAMEVSNKISIKPSKIIIKNQKSIWGSCNSKKEIRLNWRLVLMPYAVMEYIIIHELCHIKHMNHSKEFWSLVNYYCNDYKKSKIWLKENGVMLMNLV